jgi:hypothetical protein
MRCGRLRLIGRRPVPLSLEPALPPTKARCRPLNPGRVASCPDWLGAASWDFASIRRGSATETSTASERRRGGRMLRKGLIERLRAPHGSRTRDGAGATTLQSFSLATGTTCIVCRGEIREGLARLGSTKCHDCRGGIPLCIVCRGEIREGLARLGSTRCHDCRGGIPLALVTARTRGLFPFRAGVTAKFVD